MARGLCASAFITGKRETAIVHLRPCSWLAIRRIAAIEFVDNFAHLRAGQGGYNEDLEFYSYRMPI